MIAPANLNGAEKEIYAEALALALASPHGGARAKVVHEAFEWMGTRWGHRNRQKGRLVDCGNFPAAVFAGARLIEEPPVYEYAYDFYLHSLEEKFRDAIEVYCERLGKVEPLPGDIIGLQFTPNCPSICHVGITVAHPTIIHARGGAFSKDGKVELGGLTGPYLKMWSGVWRLRAWCD